LRKKKKRNEQGLENYGVITDALSGVAWRGVAQSLYVFLP
jgi:hypothetical protein